jgi:hypothetical protein
LPESNIYDGVGFKQIETQFPSKKLVRIDSDSLVLFNGFGVCDFDFDSCTIGHGNFSSN